MRRFSHFMSNSHLNFGNNFLKAALGIQDYRRFVLRSIMNVDTYIRSLAGSRKRKGGNFLSQNGMKLKKTAIFTKFFDELEKKKSTVLEIFSKFPFQNDALNLPLVDREAIIYCDFITSMVA